MGAGGVVAASGFAIDGVGGNFASGIGVGRRSVGLGPSLGPSLVSTASLESGTSSWGRVCLSSTGFESSSGVTGVETPSGKVTTSTTLIGLGGVGVGIAVKSVAARNK
jgi:hypothetical protein